MFHIKYLVEKAAYMESETIFFLLRKHFGVLVIKDPTTLREGEFQLVTIICSLVRTNDRRDFGHLKMADAHQLIVDLLLLCLELHFIWERLPFAASTDTEMSAERLQTMFRRLYHAEDETFHIIFLLLCDFDVNNVAWYGELYEQYSSVNSCESLAFGSDCFDHDVL